MYDPTWRDSAATCSWSAAIVQFHVIDLNARYKLVLGFLLVKNIGHSLLGGLIRTFASTVVLCVVYRQLCIISYFIRYMYTILTSFLKIVIQS